MMNNPGEASIYFILKAATVVFFAFSPILIAKYQCKRSGLSYSSLALGPLILTHAILLLIFTVFSLLGAGYLSQVVLSKIIPNPDHAFNISACLTFLIAYILLCKIDISLLKKKSSKLEVEEDSL